MKSVIWTDKGGYKHRALIRDTDDDKSAPKGVQCDPPDITALDWEAIQREIHNRLVDAGLMAWDDVQRSQNAINGIVRAVIVRPIIQLYRIQEVLDE